MLIILALQFSRLVIVLLDSSFLVNPFANSEICKVSNVYESSDNDFGQFELSSSAKAWIVVLVQISMQACFLH